MLKKSSLAIFAIAMLLFVIPSAYSIDNSKVRYYSVIEVTETSLNLALTSLENQDFESTKNFIEFGSTHFSKNLEKLRNVDASLTDEVHISLLDLQTRQLNPENLSTVSSEITRIVEIFEAIPEDEEYNPNVTVALLIIVDEQYAIFESEGSEFSYQIAVGFMERANQIFYSGTDYNERQKVELQSFFNDMFEMVKNKDPYASIASTNIWVQRDLLGTDVVGTIGTDSSSFYIVIKELYAELMIELDNGDYKKAEQLGIEAYLENFEYLEPEIEVADAELLYQLEWDMREELRTMIKNYEDPDVIKSFLVDSIIPRLDTAEAKVADLRASGVVIAEVFANKETKPMGSASEGQKAEVRDEIDFIREQLMATEIFYELGDTQAAYASARTAYLDSYEYVEIPLRAIAPDFTFEVEYQFATLRNQINDGAPIEDISTTIISLERSLDESERLVSGTGTIAPMIAFISSFSIIFREGLEAVLILGAIITYLEASRNHKFKKYVHYGIGLAIGATAVTWVIASYIIEISGANRELIEAIAALSATAVLFYVSFWILNKIEHKRWMEFVKAKVFQASAAGGTSVFIMLSFFTVYREGFETVLFYQAMFSFAKYMEFYVGLGFILGIVSLLGIYFGFRKLGKRLPLRALFGLTMGIGAYLSIAFLGNAIREFQVLDFIPYTSMLGTIPRLDINVATMTGIYPTLETTVGQIILLAVYLVASLYVLVLRPKRQKALASMRKSRAQVDEQQTN
ncbi:FTR1 family iron permease [Candidatus Nitrosopelagicus brevis]|uniref:FTR1 family protein n=2 Tax=Candidatus Nitrosopelagicus brevis TaxID=1410606 RepID=A0A0A7V0V1_9ARCH|nr:FTR1 family protein [Candidatus Nitrosopelagicus brevis]AJA92627.1 FTR1 family protein [Candidatus Nitrosopelagicus brevis]